MKKHLFILIILLNANVFAQEESKTEQVQDSTAFVDPLSFVPKLRIFLDCDSCDRDFLVQELSYHTFVRDQNFADVHIIIRTQRTGSGGAEYELEFIGNNDFEGFQNAFTFTSPVNNTHSENRTLMYNKLRNGLSLFNFEHWDRNMHIITAVQNSISNDTEAQKVEVPEQEDKWNNWVFSIGINGNLSGQESSKNNSFGGNLSAKQVTEKNKFFFRASYNYSESVFTYGDIDITSEEKTIDLNVSNVFSITNHWSAGAFLEAGRSTFSNHKFFASLKPGIEYSLFDYIEASKKQITMSYRIGAGTYTYDEKTIFNKEDEFLWEHSLNLGGNVRQTWGSISGEVSYQSYLHDTALHAFNFHLSTNLRISSGLSFNIMGQYSITNNQINLAGGDLALEELLLRQQQVKSGYNFFSSIGLNYRFGSMFSSIVNPRFDF